MREHLPDEAAVYVADRLPDTFTVLDIVDVLAALQADEEHAVGAARSRFAGATPGDVLGALLRAEWVSASGEGYVVHRDALPL